jgi:signal transduction histidine kinase
MKRDLTPAEIGEQAAKKEYYESQTNFPTAFETRQKITEELFKASELASAFIKMAKSTIDFKTGYFNVNINKIDADEIDDIAAKINNKLGLVSEYVRDLKKFK